MITWTPYPPDKTGRFIGEHAMHEGLTLVAFPDGAWAVYKRGSGGTVPPMASADKMRRENGLEGAKQAAEVAAIQMVNG